jgi:hypothetical protein
VTQRAATPTAVRAVTAITQPPPRAGGPPFEVLVVLLAGGAALIVAGIYLLRPKPG